VGTAVSTQFYPRTVSVNSHLPHKLHRMQYKLYTGVILQCFAFFVSMFNTYL